MSNETTILDLSKGITYGLVYHSVIGQTPLHHPLIARFKKPLVKKKISCVS
jgi:hypothetical protein